MTNKSTLRHSDIDKWHIPLDIQFWDSLDLINCCPHSEKVGTLLVDFRTLFCWLRYTFDWFQNTPSWFINTRNRKSKLEGTSNLLHDFIYRINTDWKMMIGTWNKTVLLPLLGYESYFTFWLSWDLSKNLYGYVISLRLSVYNVKNWMKWLIWMTDLCF